MTAQPPKPLAWEWLDNISDKTHGGFIVHSTNCIGNWNAGFAKDLKADYPKCFRAYQQYVDSFKPGDDPHLPRRDILGTCLIIPVDDSEAQKRPLNERYSHIICLFTSYGYGRKTAKKPGKDCPVKILESTQSALRDFRQQLGSAPHGHRNVQSTNSGNSDHGKSMQDMIIYSNCFNSGFFSVPWVNTFELVKQAFQGWEGKWVVLRPPPKE
ncbi:hypothetical protein F4776DRAFT_560984 [Hypoxylon sp. NC0597]|nr:hypothetical protein F4776DRAFT_560984 [Hypoxylon sp. NC0597]